MHDISFFLLKNWLPLGVSAIAFSGIGLLFAKAVWGRYSQRLANAVEENMNLASQWSALGASQRDLFKKLRVRWQADRDAYEAALAEKERRIALLGSRLESVGVDPAERSSAADEAAAEAVAKVAGLETSLAAERAEVAKLRDELDKMMELPEMPVLPFAVKGAPEPAPEEGDDWRIRIRDLEQDLIDTHDELHRVRTDYEKQAGLVEALEAKLIAAPAPEPAIDPVAHAGLAAEAAQLRALAEQRGREARHVRGVQGAALRMEIDALRHELEARGEEIESGSSQLAGLEGTLQERNGQIEALRRELEVSAEEIEGRKSRLAELEGDLQERDGQIETLRHGLEMRGEEIEAVRLERDGQAERILALGEELESLQHRRRTLQAELNDVHHELYDVRRTLNHRIEEISGLQPKVAELAEAQARNEELEAHLAALRDELADKLHALANAESAREDAALGLAEFRAAHEAQMQEVLQAHEAESASLRAALGVAQGAAATAGTQLNEARRELSEVRIALSAKTADHQKALAQMEELEAIIGDRSAEVNDLSAELRQQRDQMRQMKERLAETEGELEALSEESRRLNAGVKARAQFAEEQQARVADLERALAERYRELNLVRVEADEYARVVRYHESRATQLEAELERRAAEFVDSGRRVSAAEEAIEAAHSQISSLSARLEQSDADLAGLREELERVSREKDETLRELDRASRRVAELEEAARKREIQLVEIERELVEAQQHAVPLEGRIEQLQAELESALEEGRRSAATVGELEEAVRQGEARSAESEHALRAAHEHAAALEQRIGQLQAELESALEEGRRSAATVGELEEAVRLEEARSAEAEHALRDAREHSTTLEQRIERLQVELESAREEGRLSAAAVGELEKALHGSDERALELSARIDEKEAEVSALLAEAASLQALVDARAAGEAGAKERIAALEAEFEARLAELGREKEDLVEGHAREIAQRAAEVERLQEQWREEAAKAEEQSSARQASLSEIEALREKLAARVEEIRDLQNRISEVMMQKASRDSEIATLKDRLSAVDADLAAPVLPVAAAVGGAVPIYEMMAAVPEEEGTPLDELPGQEPKPEPQPKPVVAASPEPVAEAWNGGDEDLVVYFNDSAAVLSRAETEKIDRAAKSIRRYGKRVEVTVVGYAGPEGTPDFSESLSARRADAVRERLVERGVSLSVVKVRASGQDRRFSDWKARRVEMVVSPVAVAEAVN